MSYAAVGALALGAGCSAPPGAGPTGAAGGAARVSGSAAEPGTAHTPTAAATGGANPPAARVRPHPPQPITVAFAGDIHFQNQLRPRLANPGTALASLRPELSAADLTVANLETAVTTRGRPEDKRYRFRAPPSAFAAVAAAGVDVVTMANNHAVDYGPAGLRDTLAAAARAPVAVVGIGPDADRAFAPYVTRIRGTTVAVIGADAVADPTTRHFAAGEHSPGIAVALRPDRLVAAVRAARRAADLVVVYLHWGQERVGCPTSGQRDLARRLASAGADVVVGSHAHVQLGAGMLDDTFVAYGLGNFVWYSRNSRRESTTGILTLTTVGRSVRKVRWTPGRVGGDGLPRFTSGDQALRLRREFADLTGCTGLGRIGTPPV
ncbi:CapA family protein [Actinopolymorpha sp. NPDC004070]|uniref:CapA family protein n=1 Tax=Actinopolymorpha sp. NPDC004070 TaxID=3154548 RepID=UPI0033A5187A